MNYRLISNIIAKTLLVEVLFMVPALFIALAQGEMNAVFGFFVTMALALVLSGLTLLIFRPKRNDLYARDGLFAVGLTWIVLSLVGALPFLLSGCIPSYIDCVFETVSGFTTTGSTILTDVEIMPRGILYWRSFTHWLGGMGVLVFVMTLSSLTPKDSGKSMHLLRAESPGVIITKLVPRMRSSAAILYAIYFGLTVLEFILLAFGRMPVFDNICLTFGTAGTGGFGVLNDSVASYSPYCQWVITIFMILFGVNFNVYFLLLMGRFRKALGSEEVRVYLLIIATAIAVIVFNIRSVIPDFWENLRHSSFTVASIISTTGFGTVDFNLWPQLSKSILLTLMIIGACAGSTGGGVKVVRILVIFKAAKRAVIKMIRPKTVRLINVEGEALEEDTVQAVTSYMIIYFMLIALFVLLVSINNLDFETSFSAVLACLNNIGPGMAAVGPTANFAALSNLSKIVLTIAMLIGRLEIYPILLFFIPSTWKK